MRPHFALHRPPQNKGNGGRAECHAACIQAILICVHLAIVAVGAYRVLKMLEISWD